jgi:hypothetical protein
MPLRKGTRILTFDGVVRVERIPALFKMMVPMQQAATKELGHLWSLARAWKTPKKEPVWVVRAANGAEQHCSADQRWLVAVDDEEDEKKADRKIIVKRTDELAKGDLFAMCPPGHLANLDAADDRYGEGMCVGMLVGTGGHATRKWTLSDVHVADGLDKVLSDWVADVGGARGVDGERMEEWLAEHFGDDASALPPALWGKSESYRMGFVDGLFSTCGAVATGGEGTMPLIVTTGLECAAEIVELLHFYGVPAVVKDGNVAANADRFVRSFTISHQPLVATLAGALKGAAKIEKGWHFAPVEHVALVDCPPERMWIVKPYEAPILGYVHSIGCPI